MRAEEKLKIPCFSDYNKIITEKYKIPELKQIGSHYKIKNMSGKKKQQIIDMLFDYLRTSYYVIKIQKHVRRCLVRKYINFTWSGFR